MSAIRTRSRLSHVPWRRRRAQEYHRPDRVSRFPPHAPHFSIPPDRRRGTPALPVRGAAAQVPGRPVREALVDATARRLVDDPELPAAPIRTHVVSSVGICADSRSRPSTVVRFFPRALRPSATSVFPQVTTPRYVVRRSAPP